MVKRVSRANDTYKIDIKFNVTNNGPLIQVCGVGTTAIICIPNAETLI
jgi:hypothetical protein